MDRNNDGPRIAVLDAGTVVRNAPRGGHRRPLRERLVRRQGDGGAVLGRVSDGNHEPGRAALEGRLCDESYEIGAAGQGRVREILLRSRRDNVAGAATEDRPLILERGV